MQSQFQLESLERVAAYAKDTRLFKAAANMLSLMVENRYMYNFSWLGRPIIQIPQDLQSFQEIIWEVKPDLIVETGIAHGGSLIFSASMLALLEYCGQINDGQVIGIDIDIRSHNRSAIESHPLARKIRLIEGSSIDPRIVDIVKQATKSRKRVLLFLDSNHTHDHVLAELHAYASMVAVGSYCIVGDTGIEATPDHLIGDRPWGKGNSPESAVREFLKLNTNFEIDPSYFRKSWFSASENGFLKRVN